MSTQLFADLMKKENPGNSPVDNGEAGLDGFASHADIHASRKLSFSHALCEQVTASVTTDYLTACAC